MVNVANDPTLATQTLPSAAPGSLALTSAAHAALGTDDLPTDPTARAEALAAVVERQAALLQREDEVHRVLVRIVLAGGSLAELCDAVAGFFSGAAVVTTTDGRVLAMAGTDDDIEQARALGCFDRTGRLVVESEPVGPRAPAPAPRTRAVVKIVAGANDPGRVGGGWLPTPPSAPRGPVRSSAPADMVGSQSKTTELSALPMTTVAPATAPALNSAVSTPARASRSAR